MIELFLAVDHLRAKHSHKELLKSEWRYPSSVQTIVARFVKTVKRLGPLFAEYNNLKYQGKENTVIEYAQGRFRELYNFIETKIPDLWSKALEIYDHFISKRSTNPRGSAAVMRGECMRECYAAFVLAGVVDGWSAGRPKCCFHWRGVRSWIRSAGCVWIRNQKKVIRKRCQDGFFVCLIIILTPFLSPPFLSLTPFLSPRSRDLRFW